MNFVSTLIWLVPVLIVLPLAAFWLSMFRDMTTNGELPAATGALFEWPPVSRHGWTVLFIVLSLPAAVLYYRTIYRRR